MSLIKTPEEIRKLHAGGEILSRVLREIRSACIAGASTAALDRLAQKRLKEAGALPSFFGYKMDSRGPGFPGAVCVSINSEVVHGLPIPDRTVKDGDIIGLDIGAWYEGLATDMATTVMVGSVDAKRRALVEDTREALVRALGSIRAGALVSDIGVAIEDFLKPKKYGIVRDLVGHGVGHGVHEDPQIPHVRDPHASRVVLEAGMVLAIEPMVNLGTWQVVQKSDGWTIATADGEPSAHFEVTIAVTDHGYDLITPWPDS